MRDLCRSTERCTILVTGGAGFIGSHLVDALLAERRAGRWPGGLGLRVVDDLSTGDLHNLAASLAERGPEGLPLVTFCRRSVLDPLDDVMEDVDLVFHLAASVFPARSIAEPREDATTNIVGTLNVLEACRRAQVRRLVYSSSAAVYGDPACLPITEDTPPAPISPYGLSKLAAEQYGDLYTRLYGLDVVTLRYFNAYGPRQSPASPYAGVIPRFADRARHGLPLVLYGDGLQTRDFVHVSDIVRANLLAACSGTCGAYNIASGRPATLVKLASTIAAIVAELTGRVPVTLEYAPERPGDIRHSVVAVDRAAEELGFRARLGLAPGLRGLLQQMLSEDLAACAPA